MQEFINNNQFKAYMKREAARLNISVNNAYSTYIARCILKRFSHEGNENIFIKGSAAEYAYLGRLVRAIVDIDVASCYNFSDMVNSLIDVLRDRESDIFKMSLAKAVTVTDTGIYKIPICAEFGVFNQPVGIDFQENYDRLIESEIREVAPLFTGDEPFCVKVPSFEEYLAEKLCIIVETDKTDVLNTRVKDFYDIYQLHGGCYNFDKLSEYFAIMLSKRGKKDIKDVTTKVFNREFIDKHKGLWDSAQKRYDFVDQEIDFSGAVYYTRAVLREQLQKNGISMPMDLPQGKSRVRTK